MHLWPLPFDMTTFNGDKTIISILLDDNNKLINEHQIWKTMSC